MIFLKILQIEIKLKALIFSKNFPPGQFYKMLAITINIEENKINVNLGSYSVIKNDISNCVIALVVYPLESYGISAFFTDNGTF